MRAATYRYSLAVLLLTCPMLLGCRPQVLAPGPPDLERLLRRGESIVPLAQTKLAEQLGTRFPVLEIIDGAGNAFDLRETFDGPLAIFFAGGPCPETLRWARELAPQDWEVPKYSLVTLTPSYTLVTLVVNFDSPDLTLALGNNERVFRTHFPLPSYLTYTRFYPVLFYIDDKGTFVGYHIPAHDPVFMGGTPSIGTVTGSHERPEEGLEVSQ